MKKTGSLLSVLLIFISLGIYGQKNPRDSSFAYSIIGIKAGYQLPGGDLADRFGSNFNVGAGFYRKLKSNLIFSFEGEFIFGDDVRENTILDSIRISSGPIISFEGTYGDVVLYERGYKFELKAGKIFPFIGPNPNSGLLVTVGGGLLQHKIRIDSQGSSIPSIEGEYLKGYDRLTNGFSLTEFLGYINFSNSRRVNFYAGFEATQGFTQNRRDFDFDTMQKDDRKRLDLFFGFRLCWMIPLYKRMPQEYYFN